MTAKGKQWALRNLRLEEVRERPDFQLRANGIDRSHAKKLLRALEAGDDLGPVTVAEVGNALYLVDGFHRLDAHKAARRDTISAQVARMSIGEAREAAQLANTTHGLNLKRKDKQRVWADFIATGRHLDDDGGLKSSRAIEAELNQTYSRETIRQKLRAMGLELNEGPQFGAWEREEISEEDLARERLEEAEGALARFATILPTLDAFEHRRLRETARSLLDALEHGRAVEGLLGDLRDRLGI